MLLQMALFHSFFMAKYYSMMCVYIGVCVYSTSSLSIFLLKDIQVVSMSWLF